MDTRTLLVGAAAAAAAIVALYVLLSPAGELERPQTPAPATQQPSK